MTIQEACELIQQHRIGIHVQTREYFEDPTTRYTVTATKFQNKPGCVQIRIAEAQFGNLDEAIIFVVERYMQRVAAEARSRSLTDLEETNRD